MTNPSPLSLREDQIDPEAPHPTDFHAKFGTTPADAEMSTPKPMAGRWYLIAPDGSDFQGDSPIECLKAEIASRVPAKVALARIAEGLNEADATPQPSPEGGEAEREALKLALRALEDAGSMWMKSGDVGRRLAAIDAIRAALSRKETPHASD